MKTCLACGRTCATRYAWAHHGCEMPGVKREANRRAGADLPSPPANARVPRIAVPAARAALLAAPPG
jgi:hypothetical protein